MDQSAVILRPSSLSRGAALPAEDAVHVCDSTRRIKAGMGIFIRHPSPSTLPGAHCTNFHHTQLSFGEVRCRGREWVRAAGADLMRVGAQSNHSSHDLLASAGAVELEWPLAFIAGRMQ